MNEFNLIEKYFNWGKLNCDALGVGDDCALISIDSGYQLATSVDTLIENVHFPRDTSPADIAYKALSVNLSDLAAMGAIPKYFTLALTLPEFDKHWLESFSTSLKSLAKKYQIDLLGGDTTKGSLSITINVTGIVPHNKALLRSSAKVDDIIFVSNTIGDAALAWHQIQQGEQPNQRLLTHFNRPEPQIKLGQSLAGIANACIDISDGLEQDLNHILKHSKVGAKINLNNIPLSQSVAAYVKKTDDWCLPLAGGDDYQLCFTIAPNKIELIQVLKKELDIQLSAIGTITKDLDFKRLGEFDQKCSAYQHF
ncbi:thiamine-phosphate kinase [Candidatus Thioglobus sp.]|uniref:thiamine-phosphate kinase n=1 Tax=Candidatus Thioglobus sp. TaxID=2026721 RepID=UPI00260F6A6A|nr:thiamine-phosphate kinase [Candidatus Thioglobus sp.]MDG2395361.1 thiamine-phosphate kinase [Candidatus Thioglobus sp.]